MCPSRGSSRPGCLVPAAVLRQGQRELSDTFRDSRFCGKDHPGGSHPRGLSAGLAKSQAGLSTARAEAAMRDSRLRGKVTLVWARQGKGRLLDSANLLESPRFLCSPKIPGTYPPP